MIYLNQKGRVVGRQRDPDNICNVAKSNVLDIVLKLLSFIY